MNEQRAPKGIEWTRIVRLNFLGQRETLKGYTWNPTGGCFHGCTWNMPDGTVAECYAKTIAERFTQAYPKGFEHHYFRENQLQAPLKVKKPAGIFVGSMADLFGKWVPEHEVLAVLDVIRRSHWHTFMLLSKNPYNLRRYSEMNGGKGIPKNAWAGISVPANRSNDAKLAGKTFSNFLASLYHIPVDVRFISFEPLWFDVVPVLEKHVVLFGGLPFEWAIIGPTSSHSRVFQPNPVYVQKLLDVCDEHNIPVFFKGSLEWHPWREDFPTNMYDKEKKERIGNDT